MRGMNGIGGTVGAFKYFLRSLVHDSYVGFGISLAVCLAYSFLCGNTSLLLLKRNCVIKKE